jgi:hypothetical protein
VFRAAGIRPRRSITHGSRTYVRRAP